MVKVWPCTGREESEEIAGAAETGTCKARRLPAISSNCDHRS
jgi:hypothetical protein